jgi:hypothetical protein
LTDNTAQLQLTSGTLRIRVKRLGDDENFEVDTPNLAFSILRPGIYKITVNSAGDTTVIEDRRGEGEVTGAGSAYTVHAGDLDTFYGRDQLSADMESLNGRMDDFERWSEQRDHHEDASLSARYVSGDAIGFDDLDDNGDWRPVPNYGMVWFPRMAMQGWAPYHYGHWAYIAPWGYTWVDDAPWGFAPFHYGRWVTAEGRWGWVPCPPSPPMQVHTVEYVRPVYAPALVAWVGGPHFGIGIAVGGVAAVGVGWFPLGPREVYVPSYPVSRNYVSNVNVSNTTVNKTVVNNYYTNVVVNKNVNVTNVTYVNQSVPGAVAATSPQAFSSGQPVARNGVHIDAREVASAPVNAMTPSAVPQRAAVLGGRTAANARPPMAVQTRPITAKTAPPPPAPSFVQRQSAIQSNGGKPLSVAQVRQIAPVRTQAAVAPQVHVAPAAKLMQPAKPPANINAQTPNPGIPPRPASSPTPVPNNGNVAQHPQETEDLRKQQDQQRQQLEVQQKKQQQLLQQQKADEAKQRQLEQQQLRERQELEQKHKQQQELQQKQHAEHHPAPAAKPEPKPKEEHPQ